MSDYEDYGGSKAPPVHIDEMDLTIRTYNLLNRNGLTKVADILKMSEYDLLDLRNFGQKSIDELKEKLAPWGMYLASSPVNPWSDDLVHERIEIFRKRGITVTVQPNGDVDLSQAHFNVQEFVTFAEIIEEIMRRVDSEEGGDA